MSYRRFLAMIATSTVVMFGLMYSTAYAFTHVWWSQTRFWMALYMGAAMAIIMLGFMLPMYEDRKKNVALFAGSALVLAAGLFLARSQATVGDAAWMKAMIPHHSIAILTSERAAISDPRVRRLADEIILAQRREIAEMEALLADLDVGETAPDAEAIPPSVPPVEGGSEDVPGAPMLVLDEPAVRDGVLRVAEVRVASDAWVVVHPAAPGGGPDATRLLGAAFFMHGTTEDAPLRIGRLAPGDSLYAMLHDDTGTIGVFEFTGPGSPDQPLLGPGGPVVAAAAAE